MNLTLLTDLYELTMMQGYFKSANHDVAVFDAFYRKNPCDGGYAICAGLDQVIDYIKNLHFSAEDISYLRINTIALSYSLPQRVLERINFSSAALNLTLNNFFTITKYSGIDPEVPGATYPVSRSVTIGLNVGF